jgi:hypothetical protein
MRSFAHAIRSAATPVRGGIFLTCALVAAVGVSGAVGKTTPKKAVVVTDGNDAANGVVDITRVSVGAASKSRIKVNLRASQNWDANDLLASSGPPGSMCLKMWTTSEPPDQTPDYLLCVTATKDEELRASLLRVSANRLPKRVARATLDQSDRSVTLMFKQKSIGNPSVIRFAGESTRPGCIKANCIDLAPNAPKTGRLKLSTTASTGN